VVLAIGVASLEAITAVLVMGFAQVLIHPENKTFFLWNSLFSSALSPGRIIFYSAITCGSIYVIKNLMAVLEVFLRNFTLHRIIFRWQKTILTAYVQAGYAFYITRNSSFGVHTLSFSVEDALLHGLSGLAICISESIVFLFLLAIIIALNPTLALVVFFFGGIFGVAINKGLFPYCYRWGKHIQESSLQSQRHLNQFFLMFKEILLSGNPTFFITSYLTQAYKKSRIEALQNSAYVLPRILIESLFVGIFMMIIACLCIQHAHPVEITGILGSYLYIGFRLMPGLNRILHQMSVVKSSMPSLMRIADEMTNVPTMPLLHLPELTFEKVLTLRDVSFGYTQSAHTLSSISLEIHKGECIGIVGQTGSGKSTLIDLMLGLLLPQTGTLLLDHRYPVNAVEWQQKIGYVPQMLHLFDDTLGANIALGASDVDEKALFEAIARAQLQDFVSALPHGIHTVVGERGLRLSGGERQRVAIARALYRNPDILIFDEATSALDSATEEKLMETLEPLLQNRTVIMVAHRLSTLKRCHRIFVMEKGKVIQTVSYEELGLHQKAS
jgi:ABC-type multidrug transport system fused ATPase/permease subunit